LKEMTRTDNTLLTLIVSRGCPGGGRMLGERFEKANPQHPERGERPDLIRSTTPSSREFKGGKSTSRRGRNEIS